MEPTDRPGTVPTDREPTRYRTDRPAAEWVPIAESARRLGISLNATHQRRKRGTLAARKTVPGATGWEVELDATTGEPIRPDDPAHRIPTDRPTRTVPTGDVPTGDVPTGDVPTDPAASDRTVPTDRSDLMPLADLIERLTRANQDLAASAAMWQERARVLEGRLLALGAGDESQDAPRAQPAAPQATEPPRPTDGPWWRRLLRRAVDG